ncbi:MAG TPA: energy transducer TonB [Bryobacteraceae bacterium]|nr:energy transducer TonB [Bryobacteraceae bacterium]
MPTAKSQTLSVGLHLAAVILLVLLTSHSFAPPPAPDVPKREFIPLAPLPRVYLNQGEQHQGGSNQTELPARHGAPPPRARNTFIPPTTTHDPKLPMAISVAFDSPTVQIDPSKIGDPLSSLPVGALGMHGRDGIGDRCCGPGIGNGPNGTPGITRGSTHRVTAPQLIYKVEPEFSEDARKAKFSGMVVLAIEVDASGHPRAFRVVQSPGLGLEEKAIDAVKQWRFKPGYQDGKPVVTSATVEVNFRLL